MTAPVSPAALVAWRVLVALGWGTDPDRARAFLAQALTRQLPKLSVSDVREVLAAVSPAAPAGSETYDRDPGSADPGAGYRDGARFGAVVTDSGTVEHDDGPTG